MKLKIRIAFIDKYTGKDYKVGEEVEFTEERAKELLEDERNLVISLNGTSENPAPEDPAPEEQVKTRKTKK